MQVDTRECRPNGRRRHRKRIRLVVLCVLALRQKRWFRVCNPKMKNAASVFLSKPEAEFRCEFRISKSLFRLLSNVIEGEIQFPG